MNSIGAQLGEVPEQLQRLGVGQGVDIFHRPVVDDFTYREFYELAADGAGEFRNLYDLGRYVTWARVCADRGLDLPA